MRAAFVPAGIVLALPTAAAQTFVSDPGPRVCNEYRGSDFVFIADVLSERFEEEITDENMDHALSWRVRIVEQLKGSLPREATIYTSATSAREELHPGRRHIVFAELQDGRPSIGGGGNTVAAPQSDAVEAELRRFLASPPATATIRGRVVTYADRGFLDGARSLTVELSSLTGDTLRFRTDATGWFFREVPPGQWRARVAEQGWSSRRGHYSYQNTEQMTLGRGGCADIQILAERQALRQQPSARSSPAPPRIVRYYQQAIAWLAQKLGFTPSPGG